MVKSKRNVNNQLEVEISKYFIEEKAEKIENAIRTSDQTNRELTQKIEKSLNDIGREQVPLNKLKLIYQNFEERQKGTLNELKTFLRKNIKEEDALKSFKKVKEIECGIDEYTYIYFSEVNPLLDELQEKAAFVSVSDADKTRKDLREILLNSASVTRNFVVDRGANKEYLEMIDKLKTPLRRTIRDILKK